MGRAPGAGAGSGPCAGKPGVSPQTVASSSASFSPGAGEPWKRDVETRSEFSPHLPFGAVLEEAPHPTPSPEPGGLNDGEEGA